MEEIYTILARHLSGEGSEADRKYIEEFKGSNEKEYLILKDLWEKHGEINVIDFDTDKAWNNVVGQIDSKSTERTTLSIYHTVAIAAVLTAALFVSYYVFENVHSRTVTTIQTSVTEDLKRVDLIDGSTVWLNSNSEISFLQDLSEDSRAIDLMGEAFFEVSRDEVKPFIITTENARIEVLGTSFNIKSNKQETKVNVKSGLVNVTSFVSGENMKLHPGESVIVSSVSFEKESDLSENYLAWKTGVFQFKNMEISTVVEELNQFYKNKIVFSTDSLDCSLTARFNNSKLEEVIEVIELTCGVELEKQGDQYFIK